MLCDASVRAEPEAQFSQQANIEHLQETTVGKVNRICVCECEEVKIESKSRHDERTCSKRQTLFNLHSQIRASLSNFYKTNLYKVDFVLTKKRKAEVVF